MATANVHSTDEVVTICEPMGWITASNQTPQDYIAFRDCNGDAILSVSLDGMVTLSPRINLDQLKDMPLWILQAIREMVNVAIEDHEGR